MENCSSPAISSLPNETLSTILLNVARSHGFPTDVRKKFAALLQLELVCHRWHDTIRWEPRLWTECSVSFSARRDSTTTEEAGQALMDALEAFYSRSGSLDLAIGCYCGRTPTPQVVSRLNDVLISMSHRWTRMELNSYEMGPGDRSTLWIYALMDLAVKEKDRLGYSPFNKLDGLKLSILGTVVSGIAARRWVDVTAFPLCHLFPNLTRLCLRFRGEIWDVEELYKGFSFQKLTYLHFDGSNDRGAVILQDLLLQLPMLKRLKADSLSPDPSRALFTHSALESFEKGNGEFLSHCSVLSFPSLERLSLGYGYVEIGRDAVPSNLVLSTLTTMLTGVPTHLRALELDKEPLSEMDIYRLLIRLPTLETLVLQVPSNGRWETMEGHTFRKLLEHKSGSADMPLPRLREIMLHMERVLEDDGHGGAAHRKAEFAGFCALRDAFIEFVEDPRRGLIDNETDDASEVDNLSAEEEEEEKEEGSSPAPVVAVCAGPLEVAHFDYADSYHYHAGVVYHSGRDYTEPLSFWEDNFR
ncbi:hypothetical protein BKA70DRAFT_579010 [Coprinopsis sp. MPI-PUGE-AT-0042]|nr:hypothetical protein BKA70DRAFT_579010 [Coprinopsis sp. MPI-PUGE-AT-0042]